MPGKAPAKTSSKPLNQLKEEICDIGRRIYNKGFAAGNDGNISFRLGPNEVLCTPTMISKGFMKPSDLCIVDMEGNQLAGQRKRSSEILLHLTIMKERPDVNSVVHCHPPHATAFADILNDSKAKGHVAGARVVAAFKGGSAVLVGSRRFSVGRRLESTANCLPPTAH